MSSSKLHVSSSKFQVGVGPFPLPTSSELEQGIPQEVTKKQAKSKAYLRKMAGDQEYYLIKECDACKE